VKYTGTILMVLALVALALPLAGCAGGCNTGAPTLTLRNPFLLDREAATVAGERLRYVPQPAVLAAPSWSAVQGPTYVAPNVCTPPAYTVPNPCEPTVPEGVPAIRR
jgi:hypothetical protein